MLSLIIKVSTRGYCSVKMRLQIYVLLMLGSLSQPVDSLWSVGECQCQKSNRVNRIMNFRDWDLHQTQEQNNIRVSLCTMQPRSGSHLAAETESLDCIDLLAMNHLRVHDTVTFPKREAAVFWYHIRVKASLVYFHKTSSSPMIHNLKLSRLWHFFERLLSLR